MPGDVYLEKTYRKGRPLAAYLYLQRKARVHSVRTRKLASGLIADFDSEGNPIGLEITSPSTTTAEEINTALENLHVPSVSQQELAPLRTP